MTLEIHTLLGQSLDGAATFIKETNKGPVGISWEKGTSTGKISKSSPHLFFCQPPANSCLERSLFPGSSSTKLRDTGGSTGARRELPAPLSSQGDPKHALMHLLPGSSHSRNRCPGSASPLLVPLLRGFGRGGSRREKRAHQLVTVQKQMYIPAQNSCRSVSNYFGTMLQSERLIPKAPLPAPPAPYLRRSFAFDYELVTAGGVLWGTRGMREQSPGTKRSRDNPGRGCEGGTGEGTRTGSLPASAAQALRNYPLKKKGEEKINQLNQICSWGVGCF